MRSFYPTTRTITPLSEENEARASNTLVDLEPAEGGVALPLGMITEECQRYPFGRKRALQGQDDVPRLQGVDATPCLIDLR